jgi:hypothetical protein
MDRKVRVPKLARQRPSKTPARFFAPCRAGRASATKRKAAKKPPMTTYDNLFGKFHGELV